LAKRKMNMQKKRPIVEMFRRYWMFPYHGSGVSVSPPSTEEEGGRERERFMIWVEDMRVLAPCLFGFFVERTKERECFILFSPFSGVK
jgi:hypothetical protein